VLGPSYRKACPGKEERYPPDRLSIPIFVVVVELIPVDE
jgi:hypothetical protein